MPSPVPSDDPIAALSHDHSHLGALVQAVRNTLARVERSECSWEDARTELEDGGEALREGLLLHFAREEEGVFPFVEARLPALAVKVAALLADHDRVIADVVELCRLIGAESGSGSSAEAFARFEQTYGAHAQAERAFLVDVDALLEAPARAELRALLEAI